MADGNSRAPSQFSQVSPGGLGLGRRSAMKIPLKQMSTRAVLVANALWLHRKS